MVSVHPVVVQEKNRKTCPKGKIQYFDSFIAAHCGGYFFALFAYAVSSFGGDFQFNGHPRPRFSDLIDFPHYYI